jgi:hypothetical protein
MNTVSLLKHDAVTVVVESFFDDSVHHAMQKVCFLLPAALLERQASLHCSEEGDSASKIN